MPTLNEIECSLLPSNVFGNWHRFWHTSSDFLVIANRANWPASNRAANSPTESFRSCAVDVHHSYAPVHYIRHNDWLSTRSPSFVKPRLWFIWYYKWSVLLLFLSLLNERRRRMLRSIYSVKWITAQVLRFQSAPINAATPSYGILPSPCIYYTSYQNYLCL